MRAYDHPQFEKLHIIYDELEQTCPNFPYEWCDYSSWLVHDILKYEVILGVYQTVKGKKIMNRPHAWNYDSHRNLYVDLTLFQFSGVTDIVIPEIVIASPKDIPRLKKQEIDTERSCRIDKKLEQRIRARFSELRRECF